MVKEEEVKYYYGDGAEYYARVKAWEAELANASLDFKEIEVEQVGGNYCVKLYVKLSDIEATPDNWIALITGRDYRYGFSRSFLNITEGKVEMYSHLIRVIEVGRKGEQQRRYFILKMVDTPEGYKWYVAEVTKEQILKAMKQ